MQKYGKCRNTGPTAARRITGKAARKSAHIRRISGPGAASCSCNIANIWHWRAWRTRRQPNPPRSPRRSVLSNATHRSPTHIHPTEDEDRGSSSDFDADEEPINPLVDALFDEIEGLRAESRALTALVGVAQGDLRGCLNMLQVYLIRSHEVLYLTASRALADQGERARGDGICDTNRSRGDEAGRHSVDDCA